MTSCPDTCDMRGSAANSHILFESLQNKMRASFIQSVSVSCSTNHKRNLTFGDQDQVQYQVKRSKQDECRLQRARDKLAEMFSFSEALESALVGLAA